MHGSIDITSDDLYIIYVSLISMKCDEDIQNSPKVVEQIDDIMWKIRPHIDGERMKYADMVNGLVAVYGSFLYDDDDDDDIDDDLDDWTD